MHDDVCDLGHSLPEGFLELAGDTVSVSERRGRSDPNGDEEDAAGFGRQPAHLTRAAPNLLANDALNALDCPAVVLDCGWVGGDRSFQRFEVRERVADVREGADRAFDALGDFVGCLKGAVGRQFEVE